MVQGRYKYIGNSAGGDEGMAVKMNLCQLERENVSSVRYRTHHEVSHVTLMYKAGKCLV